MKKVIEEIKEFDPEDTQEYIKGINDMLAKNDAKETQEWRDSYTPELDASEAAKFKKAVAAIKEKEDRDFYNELWGRFSNAGKRYLLSFLTGEEVHSRAKLIVSLPAEAALTISGEKTVSTTAQREFLTPALAPDKSYHYTLRATFVKDGVSVVVTKKVPVQAGKTTEVKLEAAEAVAAR